jgi:homocitrate synthase NifV
MKKRKNKISIIDVTNRDGVQTAHLGLAKLEKTILNIMLGEMGVFQSEMGFPVTRHETNYINANVELEKMGVMKGMKLSGWIRAVDKDVKKAVKLTNIKHLNLSVSTSTQMTRGKFGNKVTRRPNSKGKPNIIKMMTNALDYALKGRIKSIGINAEDASRTDDAYLHEFCLAAKEHGASRVRYCDTLGYDDPFTIYDRIGRLAEKVKLPIELHCHNDLGMVVACSIAGAKAAIDAGVDAYINTSVNGIGERAGNCDLVSTILALKKSSGFAGLGLLDKKIDLSQSWKISKYAAYAFSVPIPINQVGVGANAFAHESGIHADGALKDRRNYELYDYEELGRGEPEQVETGRKITTGEYSGIKGFRNVFDKLEVSFKNDKEAVEVLELVRYANVHTQKPLTQYELKFIAQYPKQAKEILTVNPK